MHSSHTSLFYCCPSVSDFVFVKNFVQFPLSWNMYLFCGLGPDVFLISVDERAKHDQQFHSLSPTAGGYITGNRFSSSLASPSCTARSRWPHIVPFSHETRGLPWQDLKLLPRLPHNPHHAGSNWWFMVIVWFICNPPPGDKNKTIRVHFHWLTHAIFPFPTIRYLWYVVFFSTLSQPLHP